MEFGRGVPEQRAAEDHGPKEGERRDVLRATSRRSGSWAGWTGGAAPHQDTVTVNREQELELEINNQFNQGMTGAALQCRTNWFKNLC